MLRRCRACDTFMSPIAGIGAPVRPRCVACFSGDLEWAPSSGRAALYSFVIMHQLYDEAFAADIPYNLAVVETEEGVRLTSQVVGCPNERAGDRDGARGRLRADERDVAIPKFRPRVMSYDHVVYEKRGHVAYVTLNRPERMNALDAHSHAELIEIFDDFERDDPMGGDHHRRRRAGVLRRQRPQGDGAGVGQRASSASARARASRRSRAATTAPSR